MRQEHTSVPPSSRDAIDPREHVPSLLVLTSELDEFKRTGNRLHLLHAARALDDARAELRELLHSAVGSNAKVGIRS
jgi:hypothetical protein